MILSKKTIVFFSLIVFALVGCLYWQVVDFDFINFDDDLYVYNNPKIYTGLNYENIYWAFTSSHGGHWHPLSWISHMLDCELFGVKPRYMHLENAIFHALNSVLLFLLIISLFPNLKVAILTSLLFALHPLRIESVVWISERKDVLSNFFGLLAILLYIKYRNKNCLFLILSSLVLFLLSLLAKPTYMTMPFLLLAIDYMLDGKLSSKSYTTKSPYLLISLLSGLAAVYSQSLGGGLKGSDVISFSDRFSTVWLGYLTYIAKIIIPAGMGIFYPFKRFDPSTGLGAFFAVLAITYFFYLIRKEYKGLFFLWCWYLISLLPMIGFISIGGQFYADRWTYLPAIGISLGLSYEIQKVENKFVFIISGFVLAVYSLITYVNLPNWKDSASIFTHTLVVAPDNFMAHTNLGAVLDSQGKVDLATPHFEEAARLNPTYPEALNNLGRIRASQGKLTEAEDLFKRAVNIRPDFNLARYNLGLTLTNRGNGIEGMIEWLSVLKNDPSDQRTLSSMRYMFSNRKNEICQGFTGSTSEKFKEAFFSFKSRYPEHFVSTNLNEFEKSCR